jgi:VWFA-related protein
MQLLEMAPRRVILIDRRSSVPLASNPHRLLRPLALAGVVLILVTIPGVLAADPSVRIVSPRRGEVVSGRLAIMAEVDGLEGARVEFFVDGTPAGVATTPPYRVEFDFGETLRSRRIRVVASLDDARVSAEVSTRALDIDRIDEVERVDLVNLYVTVRDSDDQIVEGLERSDFVVLENGKPQEITHFSSERQRLVVALVMDSSLSMRGGKLEASRVAARRFIQKLEPEDRALVLCFDQEVRLIQSETSDKDLLAAAVSRCEPSGGTALYDAIYRSASRLAPIEGRKVVVLLSDGRDEAESGLEPGSLHTLEESLERTLRSEVIVYAVGVGKNLARELDFYGRRSLRTILEQIATSTGGRALFIKRPSQLRGAFGEIGEELRRQYGLAYTSKDTRRDGAWRELRVQIARPGLRGITRTGYFAPGQGG